MKAHDNPENYSVSGNYKRTCKALSALADELAELYPEVEIAPIDHNGRGVALSIEISWGDLSDTERPLANLLLKVSELDSRILEVLTMEGPPATTRVSARPDPRTQDDSTAFHLGSAYMLLLDEFGEMS